jgi:hypothetical protein
MLRSRALCIFLVVTAPAALGAELATAGATSERFVRFGQRACSYNGTAYSCPSAEDIGVLVSETVSPVAGVDVESVVTANDRCLTPGVGLRFASQKAVDVDLRALRLVVDRELTAPELAIGGAQIDASLVHLKPNETLSLAVIDVGAGSCWHAKDVEFEVPVVVEGKTSALRSTARIRPDAQARVTLIRETPEPPLAEPLPEPPPGFDGTMPPPDTTARQFAMVAGGLAGAVVGGAVVGVILASGSSAPTPVIVGAGGLLVLGGAASGALVGAGVEPTPHPQAAATTAYLEAQRRHQPIQAQHDAWVALQAEVPKP